ncbi:uncharacterized protein TRIVIDRAFT_65274 [Trichoderma virens Gv29-8]|uniref:Uncharacterized protein n=1 Tax=Hypocrea virens (strain Gv29-8 / FGSC 10586) TaxID=413071 RepID=G9NAN3_HYPVG|nr:uncharacterized protein TRIVIDRAFT_65274 [Trichoderma virens Gv29-8]EHK15894.1 hypothetical protein TRIVIDRAFT_65274 [Trichoderma virens Gv29-8]UKZ56338.1 hypothetical protein TrVGV298_010174 [Trichoderma virens]
MLARLVALRWRGRILWLVTLGIHLPRGGRVARPEKIIWTARKLGSAMKKSPFADQTKLGGQTYDFDLGPGLTAKGLPLFSSGKSMDNYRFLGAENLVLWVECEAQYCTPYEYEYVSTSANQVVDSMPSTASFVKPCYHNSALLLFVLARFPVHIDTNSRVGGFMSVIF